MASYSIHSICASGKEILMENAKKNMKFSTHSVSNENREGLKAWLNPFGYGWERVSYWLQRLTGVFLLIYFVGHVIETSSIIGGPDVWNSMLQLTQTPAGHLFLILVIGTSTFHSANGIRLIFTHLGKGLGEPGRPDYPYSPSSLNYRQKSGIWVALILAAFAMLFGVQVLFGKG
jgi:succinate dehydrogenase / fumarate reductase cytochrome b subunit